MTTIKKKFTFKNPYDINNEQFCNVTITVNTINNTKNNNLYYKISYENNFSDKEFLSCHPLYINHKTHMDGDIIYKNELTDVLIKFLMMSDEELSTVSGNTSPMQYRGSIMKNIANLWD